MLRFMSDPTVVADVAYGFWFDQLDKQGVSRDEWDDMLGDEDLEKLRNVVDQRMRGFSALWKIISTNLEEILHGDSNLMDKVQEQQIQKLVETSGPSS